MAKRSLTATSTSPSTPPPQALPAVAAALIGWHARHGRHDLPWQQDRTPYRVWVSEVMLQQTQVVTVIPYYLRFMERFPDVRALAGAPIDDVLHLWTGLGYYSRARNLHRAAVTLRDAHGGEFPRDIEAVAALPGIGRSTAGAILALSLGARHPILDGNVRRVLSRYFGIARETSESALMKTLWERAEACTPGRQVEIYTQAIMDMGATLCTRHKPLCAFCPLTADCVARLTGRQEELPTPKAPRARRERHVYMPVVLRADGSVRLERRPDSGVWGGLWCLPELPTQDAAHAFLRTFGIKAAPQPLPEIFHAFTHFDLVITPLLARGGPQGQGAAPGEDSATAAAAAVDAPPALWYNIREPARIGLPAPIKTLLEALPGLVQDAGKGPGAA